MTKFAIFAAIPLLAGYALAQDAQRTETTTTQTETKTTNWNGSLVDQGCYTQRVHKTENNSDGSGSTQTESTKVTTDCPVTAQTTSFGLVTSDGRYVRFDDEGNQRIVEMMKTNKDWDSNIQNKKPVEVRVVGTANGDILVIKQIR